MRTSLNLLTLSSLLFCSSFAKEVRLAKEVTSSGYYDCRATTEDKDYVCQLLDLNKKIASIHREYERDKKNLKDPYSCGFHASGDRKLTRKEKSLISDLIFATNQKNRNPDTNLSRLGSEMENIENFVRVGRSEKRMNSIVQLIYSAGAPQFYIDSEHKRSDEEGLVYIPQPLINLKLNTLSRCIDDWTSADRDFEKLSQLPKEVYEGYLKLLGTLDSETDHQQGTLRR